jgi:MFS family permease
VLAARGYTTLQVGVVLTTLIAGAAVASLVVGAFADRIGRRRSYALFFAGIGIAGAIVALGVPFWLLLIVAITGTLSTDVIDNGPATTLEQTMLAAEDGGTATVYGRYNMIGSAAGALGALAVILPGLRHTGHPALSGWFTVLIPAGLLGVLIATKLSSATEARAGGDGRGGPTTSGLGPSRKVVHRLATLFAMDAGGSGLVTTGFLSYYFASRYHVTVIALGWLFFSVSLVQAASVALAPRLARRYGLVATMVGSHLPSNVLLAAVAFAPTFPVAAGLLLARTTLSQMDVPTRQALVMTVVRPEERTAASAVTNAARYTVRPVGPLIAGAVQQLALGAPLVIAGTVKGAYDVTLWLWARNRLPAAVRSKQPAPAEKTSAKSEQ